MVFRTSYGDLKPEMIVLFSLIATFGGIFGLFAGLNYLKIGTEYEVLGKVTLVQLREDGLFDYKYTQITVVLSETKIGHVSFDGHIEDIEIGEIYRLRYRVDALDPFRLIHIPLVVEKIS